MRKVLDSRSRGSRSRETLTEAAARLLDARDAADISITDVVNAAGVTRPTFYQAFDDLSEVFVAAALSRLDAAFTRIDGLSTDDEIREVMGRAFHVVLEALAEHELFFRRVLDSSAAYALVTEITRSVSNRLQTVSPIASPLNRASMPSGKLGSALASGAIWIIIDWLTTPETSREPLQVIAHQTRDFVLGSVLDGLAATPPSR